MELYIHHMLQCKLKIKKGLVPKYELSSYLFIHILELIPFFILSLH